MLRYGTLAMSLTMVGLLASGCGPTAEGKRVRAEAEARVNTQSANLTYNQAMQSFEHQKFDQALREIDAAISRYPHQPEYHVLRGRIFLETLRLEDALAALAVALEQHPTNDQAHYYSGIIFQRWSDDEQAFEHYRQASEANPNNLQYLLAAAESLIALGEFHQAEVLIAPRIKKFEHNVALKQLQGQLALLNNQPEVAAQRYAEARMLAPDDLQIIEQLTWAQFDAGDYEGCYKSLSYLQAKNKTPRIDLSRLEAQCLTMLGRSIEARDLYVNLSRQIPNDADIWIELGTVCWEIGDETRLRDSAVKVLNMAPDRHEGYLLKAMYEQSQGHEGLAIDLMNQSAMRALDDATPHILLGRMLEGAGRTDEALNSYQNALTLDPGSDEAQKLYERLRTESRVTAAPTDGDG